MTHVYILFFPALLGLNLWSGIQPLGAGSSIMDLEDFLISDNLLPLGSLVYLLFCVSRKGWGWDHFLAEANTGDGIRFPAEIRRYVTWVLPLIVLLFLFWATGTNSLPEQKPKAGAANRQRPLPLFFG